MNNILIDQDWHEYSRYKISTRRTDGNIFVSFILAGATYGSTQANITAFEVENDENYWTGLEIHTDTINGREYKNIEVSFGELSMRIGSVPTTILEADMTFKDALTDLLGDLDVGSNIHELRISDDLWNNNANLMQMTIRIPLPIEQIEEIEGVEDTEELIVNILDTEVVLEDEEVKRILATFSLSHFLKEGLFSYTAEVMHNLQDQDTEV